MHSHEVLGTALCPWLAPAFTRLASRAAESRMPHALLLAGPAGVGKLNLAFAIAERLLSPDAPEPGDLGPAEAGAVRRASGNHHPDLRCVFPSGDKRSISIDQIRELTRELTLSSMRGAAKVAIIEPADEMTHAAADALLKTLEEPAANTYLLLVSHRPGRLPATIRSRCQSLSVPRPRSEHALEWLGSVANGPGHETWSGLLTLADGAPLRALALFDADFHKKNIEFEDKFKLISSNALDPMTVADEWYKEGAELPLTWLATRLRLAIRRRMAPEASNRITVIEPDPLHNAWQDLTLKGLFEKLEATESLLNQIGKGTNVELALRVLLLAFYPQRGRS